MFLGTVVAALVGGFSYIVVRLSLSDKHVSRPEIPDCVRKLQKTILENVKKVEEERKSKENFDSSRQPVISGQIDQVLGEIFDLAIDDFILFWLKDLLLYPGNTRTTIKEDLMVMVDNFGQRLAKIDPVQFITGDTVVKITEHFEKIRVLQNSVPNQQSVPVFTVLPHLGKKHY